jgi:5-(carboxyamino)imidazole ribonucleotide synthase
VQAGVAATPIHNLGVIGGGQLGRMFALDAKRMGYHVITLDPQEHSPCGQVADEQIVAAYDDLAAIEELGRRSDVVTYEFENIAIASVEHLEALGYRVTPGSGVLRITQNRLLEKRFIRACGLPTAAFAPIERDQDVAKAAAGVGFPAVLKTVHGGYDGKGQWRPNSLDQASEAVKAAGGAALIFERRIDFERELSVIATRNAEDEVVTYPVAENTHDRGILTMTVAPARVPAAIAARAQAMAETIGRNLGIVGTFCVEFFLTRDGELLVNEIAPRPHNSGHYTIDVTPCSQYEQHIRAICDLPASPPRTFCSAVMMNILGDGSGDVLDGIAGLLRDPAIVLHVYGKKHAIARRKMGHFTVLVDGPVTEAAIAQAQEALRELRWIPAAGATV